MLRSILLLNLPGAVRTKLQSMGYEYIEDIETIFNSKMNIPHGLKTIFDEYKIADKILSVNTPLKVISAATLWHNEFSDPPVAVFHEGLDKMLDGGLPVGRITELCGPPGSGKTQMCLQFCVDVQIPPALGGSGGEVLYISTDFGFGIERLSEIILASIQHCQTVEFSSRKEKDEILKSLRLKSMLDGVNVLQVYHLNDLIRGLKNLSTFLETKEKIKLLIIDSFSLLLVTEVEDLLLRSKIIADMLDVLLDNAIKFRLAVVLTNQLSTILTPNNKAILKPSLGEGFGHRLHVRLLLDNGKIYLTKSIKHPQMYTAFEITKDGIR